MKYLPLFLVWMRQHPIFFCYKMSSFSVYCMSVSMYIGRRRCCHSQSRSCSFPSEVIGSETFVLGNFNCGIYRIWNLMVLLTGYVYWLTLQQRSNLGNQHWQLFSHMYFRLMVTFCVLWILIGDTLCSLVHVSLAVCMSTDGANSIQ